MPTTASPLDAMIAHVQAKSLQDAGFRAAFLKDPKATTEAEFGIALPAVAKLQAVEAPADTVVVVLPAASANGELSDGELEAVAGGSKQAAEDFFNDVGRVIDSVARQTSPTSHWDKRSC